MATATITVHALCYMAIPDGSTVAITGVMYSAIAMADRTFDPRVSLMSIPQGSGTQRSLHVGRLDFGYVRNTFCQWLC